MNATGWTKSSKETFSMSLDNLVLSPDSPDNKTKGKIKFLTWVKDHKHIDDNTPTTYEKQSGDGGYYVHFKYKFSVWDRFLKLKDSNVVLRNIYNKYVNENSGSFSVSGTTGLIDPNYLLFYTTVDPQDATQYALEKKHGASYDFSGYDWDDDMTIRSTSSYDGSTGEMKFNFNFDTTRAGDFMQAKVTYKKVKR